MNLSPADLERLMAEGEGRSLEFKRGLPRDEKVARILCAFANTRGGVLLVGVTDRGRPCGVDQPRRDLAQVQEVAAHHVAPPIALEGMVLESPAGPVVACSVARSPERPHVPLASGEVVVRVGSSNRIADGATLRALRSHARARGPRDELERRILVWVEQRARRSPRPEGDASAEAFAHDHNLGLQRARRVFARMERDGLLVAHGEGRRRAYHRP